MNKIRNLIIITSLIIIVLIVIILLRNNTINNEQNIIQNNGQLKYGEDLPEEIEVTNEINSVSNRSRFNTVEKCIQNYYDILNNKSSSFYIENDDGTSEQIISNEEIKKLRLDLLSKEYILKNNIGLDNINEYIVTVNEKVIVIALQMKELTNITTNKYVVYGNIINLNYEILHDFYVFVNLDTEQKTFSIEPINEKYESIDEIKFENVNSPIEKNGNNKYIENILDYEESAKKYFTTYKRIILSNPKLIYNYYLDDDYKTARYGTLEKFEKYVKENKEEIKSVKFEKYLVNEYKDYRQFVCKDQYENVYIFDEELPMQFNLKLDTYTIETDNFKETYESSADKDKVAMNINKWVSMLNNRDYEAAYNVLDETFRNNNFGSVEKFEEYMRDKYPLHYSVKQSNMKKESNAYVIGIVLTDIIGEDESEYENNIIMQLKEGTDFVMSFDVRTN